MLEETERIVQGDSGIVFLTHMQPNRRSAAPLGVLGAIADGLPPANGAEHFHPLAVDLVRLDLGHVVRDVVDLMQVPVLDLARQHRLKRLPRGIGQNLSISKREVRRTAHRRQIGFTFRRIQRRADQLPIGQLNPIALHRTLKFLHVVRADLMPKAARSTVDLHYQAPLLQTHHLCGVLGKHPVLLDPGAHLANGRMRSL